MHNLLTWNKLREDLSALLHWVSKFFCQIVPKYLPSTVRKLWSFLLAKYLPKSPSPDFMTILLCVVTFGKLGGKKRIQIFYPFLVLLKCITEFAFPSPTHPKSSWRVLNKTCRGEKQDKWEEVFCYVVQRYITPIPWQHCQGQDLRMTLYKSFLFSELWDSQIMFSLANHVVQKSGCVQKK